MMERRLWYGVRRAIDAFGICECIDVEYSWTDDDLKALSSFPIE